MSRGSREIVELLDSQPDDEYTDFHFPMYHTVSSDASDDDICIIVPHETPIQHSVGRVMDVFPDADIEEVRARLVSQSFDEVINIMAFRGYTKVPAASSSSSSSHIDTRVIDFNAPSDRWVTSEYVDSALTLLHHTFSYLKVAGLKDLLHKNGNVYWKCCEYIMNIMQAANPDMYNSAAEPPTVDDVYGKFKDQKQLLAALLAENNLHLKATRPKALQCSPPINATLRAELEWYKRRVEAERVEQMAKMVYDLNEENAAREGALVECGCCFGEYAFENMVQCTEGHLFCRTCLAKHTEQILYGNGKTAVGCMSTVEKCDGFFSDNMLKVSLPGKVYDKFAEAQCRDVIKAANLDNIIACYNCAMLTQLPSDAGKILTCPNCNCTTCRDCGEVSHIPLRCEEVEKKDQTSLRVRVEEALTKAKIRECPKCHQKFYKSDGCNKMTCPCGTYVCYICRANITKIGYAHFCQTAHCNHKTCKKCTMYSDSAADDQLAMRDAGLKEIESATGSIETGGSNGQPAAELNIDLDKYLDEKPKKRQKLAPYPVPPAPFYPYGVPGMAPPDRFNPAPVRIRAGVLVAPEPLAVEVQEGPHGRPRRRQRKR